MSEDCYSDKAATSLENALEECRQQREKLRAQVRRMRGALDRAREDFDILISRGDLADEPLAHQTLAVIRAAIAREPGLLKDE